MLYIGIFLLACCFFWMLASGMKRLNLNRREWLFFILIFIGGLVLIAFSIEPPLSWDLYRHYELINAMREGGMDYVLTESIYKHLPITNMLYALIALIGIPNLLPCFVVIVCYSTFAYMLWDFSKIKGTGSQFVLYAIIANLALCPFLHMVSGIRNILAYALCAFAFYNELYKKRKITAWIIYISCVFIHPASLIIIGIRLVFTLYKIWKFLGVIAAVWSLLAGVIAEILTRLPFGFFESIGWKLKDYMGNQVFSGYKILVVKLIFLVSMIFVIEYTKRQNFTSFTPEMRNYFSLLELLVLITVGSFRTVFIADRLCYLIAFFAPPALSYIYTESKGRIRHLFSIEMVIVFTLLFMHQFLYFSKT